MATILMVIAPENFRDEEFLVPKSYFEQQGHRVFVASTRKGACRGMLGATVQAEYSLAEVRAADYDAVVFVGGAGTPLVRREQFAIKLAQDAAASGKVLAAICWAPTILAKADVLNGRKATVWLGNDGEYGTTTDKVLEKFKAKYEKSGVVIDGKVVTADGPAHAKQFAEAIVRLL